MTSFVGTQQGVSAVAADSLNAVYHEQGVMSESARADHIVISRIEDVDEYGQLCVHQALQQHGTEMLTADLVADMLGNATLAVNPDN